jgi:hypothetical protein
LGEVRKGRIQLVPGAGPDDKQFPAERVRRCLQIARDGFGDGIIRVDQKSN